MHQPTLSSRAGAHRALRLAFALLPALLPICAAGCATLGAGAGGGGGDSAVRGLGEPMPEVAVEEFWDRKELRLSALRGKVVLLDIWASWCVPCKDEMPTLDEMARRFQGQGVEIIAVSIDEDRLAAEQFLKRRKRWSLTLAHDPAGSVPDRLQPAKMPTSYVIDRAGILRHINTGFEPADAARIEAQIAALAAK
jgi:cytochrome c biogenesis protein CcmG, thiol:disulfide interchange protein DsbE